MYIRTWEVNFGYVEQGEKKNALGELDFALIFIYSLSYIYILLNIFEENEILTYGPPAPCENVLKFIT